MAKRISQLTALTSASLDTTLLGIDRGVSYKIELDVLADAVKDRINTLDDIRLDSLENFTASFTASVASGTISGSSQLTSSFDTRYTLSGSVVNVNTSSLVNRLNAIESLSGSWITESETGSFLTSLSGAISSSAQVVGILSSLNSVSASLISKTGSYATTGSNTFIGNQTISGSVYVSGGFEVKNSEYSWNFNSDGTTTFPNDTINAGTNEIYIQSSNNTSLLYGALDGNWQSEPAQNQLAGINVGYDGVTIQQMRGNDGEGGPQWVHEWAFNKDGTTKFPNDIINGGINKVEIKSSNYVEMHYEEEDGVWQNFPATNKEAWVFVDPDGAAIQVLRGDDGNGGPEWNHTWRFNKDGAIALPGGGNISEGGVDSNAIKLTPANGANENQALLIYPTAGAPEGNHIHLTANGGTTELYIGDDNHFVKLANSGNVDIRSYQPDSPYSSATWTFGTDGAISTTDNLILNIPNGVPNGVTSWIGQGGWNQGFYSNITASGGTGTGLTVDVAAGGAGYITINQITINTAGTGYTNGDIVTINNENNLPGTFIVIVAGTNSWEFNIDGDLVFPDSTIQTTAFIPTKFVTTSSFNSLTASLSGVISGSPQLTSSFDTRYTLSGSVVSGTTPAGTISGSSQLTSSFDSRYVLETETGSLQTSITSLNTFTASAQSVTTGSNSFNGTQTITGSLIITTGSFVASQILANTASLYLTSGSNLYVQNNGIVEITGSMNVSGSVNIISTTALQIGTGSGDEGGEILLAKSQTNNSLTGSGITIDSFQNKLRIFEQGGNARGVYIDLIKAPNGVGGELLWKASGLVNSDVDVTLGNLKARLGGSGNRSLQLSTVSGTYSVYGSSVYSYNGIGGITLSSPLTITTTPTYISAGYNFLVAGSTDTWIITDTSAGISWRISLMIGPSFTNNMISIERLV